MRLNVTVNGTPREADGVWEGESLLSALRDHLDLPGSKNACEQGECGSCSVYLDGELVCACLVLAAQAEGREVVTVEGLAAPDGGLHEVQRAFVETGRRAVRVLHARPDRRRHTTCWPAIRARRDPEIREALAGNLCRCTGYEKILDAVRLAAARDGARGMTRTVIEGCAIATVDAAGTEHADGHLVIEGDRIVAVGAGPAPGDLARDAPPRSTARGCLATPGPRQLPPPPLPVGDPRPRAAGDAVRVARRALSASGRTSTTRSSGPPPAPASPRSRVSGCSTSTDHHYVFPSDAGDLLEVEVEAAASVGLRFHPCRGSMDLGRSDGGLPPDEVVEDRDASSPPARPRSTASTTRRPGAMVRVALAPCSPFSVTRGLMTDAAELARRRGVRLHTHLAETLDEEAFCREQFGLRAGRVPRRPRLARRRRLARALRAPRATPRSRASARPAPASRTARAPTRASAPASRRSRPARRPRARRSASASTAPRPTRRASSAAELRQALLVARLRGGPAALTARARARAWARSAAPAASAATTSSARSSPASSPTSRCGGSTASPTPASTTRSPRSSSARRGRSTRCSSAAARSSRAASCARPTSTRSRRTSPARAAGSPSRWRRRCEHDPARPGRPASGRPRRSSARTRSASRRPRIDGIPKVKGEFAYSSDMRRRGDAVGRDPAQPAPARGHLVASTSRAALAIPGVHAVLTARGRPRPQDLRHGARRPARARDAPRPLPGRAGRDRRRRPPRDRAPRGRRDRVEYEVLAPLTRRRGGDGARTRRERRTLGRQRPAPRAASTTATPTRPPTSSSPASTRSACRTRRSSAPSPASPCPTARAASTSTSPPSGCTSTATSSPRASACRRRRCASRSAGVGGAFGGREDLSMQIHACMLALHTGRPVKIVYNREESFFGHVHRHPCTMRYEHGATHDGDLVYVRARIVLDGGAYASSSTAVVANAGLLRRRPVRGAQRAHRRLRDVYTNNPPCGAMRGFGAVQVAIGHEAQMDKLAAALGMDPVDLRIRNAMTPGSPHADRPGRPRAGAGRRAARAPAARCRCRPQPAGARDRDLRELPGGVVEHDPRRGRAPRRRLRRRLQERRLLRGLRRLLDRARAAVDRRRRAARRGPHRRRRGRPGRRHGPGADRADRARRRARRGARPPTPGSARPGRARPRARPTSPAAR